MHVHMHARTHAYSDYCLRLWITWTWVGGLPPSLTICVIPKNQRVAVSPQRTPVQEASEEVRGAALAGGLKGWWDPSSLL